MKKLLLLLVFSASLFASAQTQEFFVLGPNNVNSPEHVILGGVTISVGDNTFNVIGDDIRISTTQSPTTLAFPRTFQLLPEHLSLGQTLTTSTISSTTPFTINISYLTPGEDVDILYFRDSNGVDFISQINITDLPETFSIPRSIGVGIYTIGLEVDGEITPTPISISENRFEYPCGQSMVVDSPNEYYCGGGVSIPFVNFRIQEAGEYIFNWADDAEDEYQTPIYVSHDGSVAVGRSVARN